MANETRETWKKRIEQWAQSGLTAKEFAEEAGVNVHTLRQWKWLLSSEKTPRPTVANAVEAPSFVEVVVPRQAGHWAPVSRPTAPPLELVMPGGVVVRIPSSFDADTLRRVVDVLGGR